MNAWQTQIRSPQLRAAHHATRQLPAAGVFTEEHRNRFLTLVNEHADDRRVLVHGYALMSNHIHLVVTGREDRAVSRLLQHVTRQYAQYRHGRLNRRGRLWQSRFYSCVLDTHHFLSALATWT